MMTIYVYNLTFVKMAAVTRAAAVISAEIKYINRDDLHKSIEYIVGKNSSSLPGKDRNGNVDELLLFDGLDSEDLDRFLEEYKKLNAAPVEYKAIITPINLKWSPAYLFEHIKKEISFT